METISSSRMRSFANSYRQFQERMGIRYDSTVLLLRAKWAIRDRERFSSLINELNTFVKSLNDLLPAPQHHHQLRVRDDHERLAQDIRSLRLIQEASKRDHSDWSDAASIRADATEMGTEDLQRIESWQEDIEELPQEDFT